MRLRWLANRAELAKQTKQVNQNKYASKQATKQASKATNAEQIKQAR